MESPLADLIGHLKLIDVIVLAAAGIVMAYCVLLNRVDAVMFALVLSASLVGTTVPIIDSIASLVRWISVLLLLSMGVLFTRIEISLGSLLFLAYVYIGLVSLFHAISISWQLQRGMLLLAVATSIPIAYSNRSYRAYRSSLILVAIVACIFAVLNAVSLPTQLSDAARSAGYSKTAPTLTVALGGLLPFAFWGLWNVRSSVLKVVLGLGFLAGTVTLVLSGQRAGTLAGIIGLIPLLITTMRRKRNIGWSLVILAVLALSGFFLLRQASMAKISFLLSRYSLDSGLSNRDLIWQRALSEVAKNPFLGQGIGASEWIASYSFHNAYLEIWFNAGILGLLFFLGTQIYLFYRIICLGRISTSYEAQSIQALALGYMLGFVVLCTFESLGAGASNLNLILYLFLGVLVSSDVLFRLPATATSVASPTPGANPKMAVASRQLER